TFDRPSHVFQNKYGYLQHEILQSMAAQECFFIGTAYSSSGSAQYLMLITILRPTFLFINA
ncbi:MAG: hypothetical protein J6S41_05750, partial [Clostridia bacterium]|nr:hypothetical protein [Clostridia bacterium]